jgi:hypothetical protein
MKYACLVDRVLRVANHWYKVWTIKREEKFSRVIVILWGYK